MATWRDSLARASNSQRSCLLLSEVAWFLKAAQGAQEPQEQERGTGPGFPA